ncbi:MAG: helix-turn-helix transcriptional regulator [Lachnospiraceae bacterium]|nr:helix-turn-helix transcriptional regulator [Lachnospiraceae bacterium]
MEKKTIGKFIAILRRANGMTQKELGEKLYVSDKTVSRWERDECTPELSLIPAIAEIFGITTDELLRGERNSGNAGDCHEDENLLAKRRAKGDKQFRTMLYNRQIRHRNQSLISMGISGAGLIGAMICNLGFTRGLIGFCVTLIFLLAGVICQLCFTSGAMIRRDEEDDRYDEEIRKANTVMIAMTRKVMTGNIALLAFVIPLAVFSPGAYSGLEFGTWVIFGMVFVLMALVAVSVLDILWLRGKLIRQENLYYEEKEAGWNRLDRRLLKRLLVISLAIILALCPIYEYLKSYEAELRFTKAEVFDNYADFVEYMELHADDERPDSATAMEPSSGIVSSDQEEVFVPNIDSYERQQILDVNGNVVCEYIINLDFVWSVQLTPNESGEHGLPVKVYTRAAMMEAYSALAKLRVAVLGLMVLDVVICAGVYVVCAKRRRK